MNKIERARSGAKNALEFSKNIGKAGKSKYIPATLCPDCSRLASDIASMARLSDEMPSVDTLIEVCAASIALYNINKCNHRIYVSNITEDQKAMFEKRMGALKEANVKFRKFIRKFGNSPKKQA